MKFSEINFLNLLKNFSRKEIIEFDKFVSSPYHNSQSALIILNRDLINFYPDFCSEELTKEKLFKRVFPAKKFSDTLLRKYISNLMKLAEDFLICKDISGNEERKMISLLDQYSKRNLTYFFEKQLAKTEKNLPCDSKITVETFYYKHFREELKSGYFIRINKIHLIKPCLIKSHIYILLQMLLTNTVYANMMLIVQKTFKDTKNNEYFEKFNEVFDLISYLENYPDLENNERSFVELCKIDFTNLKAPHSIGKLGEMKSIIFKMADVLSDNLLYTFFSHLNIYYLMNMSKGNHNLKRDLFENYKFMIERGLYIMEGNEYMNYSEYRTILIHSMRLKEFEWTEAFIRKFSSYHEPEMRKNIVSYSTALLNYERREYDRALKLIASIKLSDVIMKLDVDVLLLLIYFDLNYVDNALSLIDSLRHYLSEIKILSGDVIVNHLNFLKYYRILMMEKNNNSGSQDFCEIKKEILNNNNLRRREWLLEKIDGEFSDPAIIKAGK